MLVSCNYFCIFAEGPAMRLVHSSPALVLTKFIIHQQKLLLSLANGQAKRQCLLGVLGTTDSWEFKK